jgi:uncharacterized protein (DUF2249 family)
MAEVSMMPRHRQRTGSAGLTARLPLTLAEEHVLLRRQVAARAEELLTAAADGRWPGTELAALAGYVQAEVLRQISDEETLLFPAAPFRQAAALARDHARLRSAAELLARVAAGEQPMSPAQVAAVVCDFATQLERHLWAEENLLASQRAPRGVPGTAALGGHPHEWYPLTEGPVVDLDALPDDQAVAAAVDRLLRMRRGEQVELQAGIDLDPVWREISKLSPDGYQFTVLQDGPDRWRMRVTRRRPAR